MASDKILNSSFNWGDPVMIKQTAPECYKPGSIGSICGIRTINSLDIAQQFNQAMNSELYLIEFSDGKSLEIPKAFLSNLKYLKYIYKSDFLKLIIEEDDVGFYLIIYNDPQSEKSSEDYLVDSLEEAFAEAEEKFGVSSSQWNLQNKE